MARETVADFDDTSFGSALINEYIWEAYGIPMASLSRFPYPEYHSSLDDLSAIDPERLEEAVRVLVAGLISPTAPLVRRRFTGTICLSNPKFDL